MKYLILILLMASAALAQTSSGEGRYDSPGVSTTATIGGVPGIVKVVPNASIRICSYSLAPSVPCSPLATTFTDATGSTACLVTSQVTLAGTNTCTSTADANGNFGFWAPSGVYVCQISGSGITTTNVTCNASAGTAFTGSVTFTGGSPWYDVTGVPFSAKCNGVTDDTTAIQTALNTANGVTGGGTVFFPRNRTGPCVVSALNMTNFNNITLIDGFNPSSGNGNTSNATLKFTGTCSVSACLLLQSTLDLTFAGIKMWFPNATSGPMVDMKKNGANPATANIRFHGGGMIGPGTASSVGPLVLSQDTNFVLFDDWFQFGAAGVFVEGPPTNASGTGLADNTIFRNVVFQSPFTAAIQNPSVGWTFDANNFQLLNSSSNCVPAIQFVGGFNNQQNLTFIGNTVLAPANCTNSVIFFQLPAVSGDLGSMLMNSNLIVGASNALNTNSTLLSLGNNQQITFHGNNIAFINTQFSVGTGVGVDVAMNAYTTIGATFLSGTPATGRIIDNNGNATDYGPRIFNNNFQGPQTAQPAGVANSYVCHGNNNFNGALSCQFNNDTDAVLARVIRSGTAAMTTAAIAAGNCGTTVTVAANGVATTDTITWAFNAAPGGQNAGLVAWPTANNVNFAYCSNTAETPAAATINWRVIR